MIDISVLVLATTFPRWNEDTAPAFVYELSSGLRRGGYDIVVLAPHGNGAQLKEDMGGLKVYRFPYYYPKKYQRLYREGGILLNIERSRLAKIQVPFFFLAQLYHALKLSRKEKTGLIHAHWIIPSGLVGAICKKIFKKPLIVTVHAGDVFPLRRRYLRFLAKIALDNCDMCTVNSSATKDAVLAISDIQDKIEVIPMGVNLEVFTQDKEGQHMSTESKESGFTVLTVGRLVEKKGIKYLIEAVPLIRQRISNVRLVIAGDGPEEGELRRITGELGLGERVHFVGPVANKELPKLYRIADLFVAPSVIDSRGDTEGLGIVLLEAMACGTPVVGSNVGGILDIIVDGWNGFLSQQKNPQDLADKIVQLLSNGGLRQRFSKNGLETVAEKFAWEAVTERFCQVYEAIH